MFSKKLIMNSDPNFISINPLSKIVGITATFLLIVPFFFPRINLGAELAHVLGQKYLNATTEQMPDSLALWTKKHFTPPEALAMGILICAENPVIDRAFRQETTEEFTLVLTEFRDQSENTLCQGYLPGTNWLEHRDVDLQKLWEQTREKIPQPWRWLLRDIP